MPVFLCAFCIFSFPTATPEQEFEVKRAVERHFAEERRPWSEVAGPYARVRLTLLTPEAGVVDAVLHSYSGMEIEVWTTRARLIVRKSDDEWQVWRRMR